MKNSARSSLALVLLAFTLAGCDITSLRLRSSGYYVERSDPDHVYVVRKSELKVVVDDQVVDYRINGNYLLVLRMVAINRDCLTSAGVITMLTNYTNAKEYWIVDLRKEVEIGPLTEAEYGGATERLGLKNIELVVPDRYRSNTAAFMAHASKCRLMSGNNQ